MTEPTPPNVPAVPQPSPAYGAPTYGLPVEGNMPSIPDPRYAQPVLGPRHAAAVGYSSAIAPAGPVGKDRSGAGILGLSIITLGIYYLVWYGKIQGEIRRHDPSIKVRSGLAVIAAMLPIFNIVSAYATAERIRQMQLDDGAQQTISPVVALLLFLFLGIGYPLYLASQLREHWHGHRRVGAAF